MSKEAKKEAKKKAAELGISLTDYLDETILGKRRNKGGGFGSFF